MSEQEGLLVRRFRDIEEREIEGIEEVRVGNWRFSRWRHWGQGRVASEAGRNRRGPRVL